MCDIFKLNFEFHVCVVREDNLVIFCQQKDNSKKFKKRKEKSNILDCPLNKAVKFLHREDY